jgi:cell division protein FtsB
MVKEQQGKWVVPNPQIPRSFGMMNIIFGSLMLLVALGYGCWFLYMPTFTKQMQTRMNEQQAQMKAENDEKIVELKKKEEAAKTEEEKQDLKAERELVEKRNQVDLSEFGNLMGTNIMNDPRAAAFYYGEILAAIVLNVLMIVAGAGLLGLTEWGRRLGILVAQLKILRWIVMTALTMTIVLPISMEVTQKAMKAVEVQMKMQGGARATPFPMTEFARIGVIIGAVWIVFTAIVASVYPAMMWWYLSRPAARAACMDRPKPELPEPDPQWETTV